MSSALASIVFLLTADNHGNSTVCSQASQTMQFIMTQCRNCYYTPRMGFLLFLIEYLIYDYVHTYHLAIIIVSTLCESSYRKLIFLWFSPSIQVRAGWTKVLTEQGSHRPKPPLCSPHLHHLSRYCTVISLEITWHQTWVITFPLALYFKMLNWFIKLIHRVSTYRFMFCSSKQTFKENEMKTWLKTSGIN